MLSNREMPSTCNTFYKPYPKQAAAFILPVAVSLFLPLTGNKTGFYRSRTWAVSKCLLNNNIDTLNISLDDALCYQYLQKKNKANRSEFLLFFRVL